MPGDKPQRSDRKDDGVELETQFILRLPEETASNLRTVIQTGINLKDKLSIMLENDDLRKGMVRFEDQYFYSKVVDLPCIVESMKTIDKKSFYKTADICQMMICREEPFPVTEDPIEKEAQKNKKKDPNKIDKKFLYPHGLTPCLKNVRKRRFRKTLKKKNVELPEIEKEVKRLLRVDNEAVSVKWEIVESEEQQMIDENEVVTSKKGDKKSRGKGQNKNIPVDERRIFGEEVSDSEEDDEEIVREMELDETRLSADDSHSRFSDSVSNSMMLQDSMVGASQSSDLVTEFAQTMFDDNPCSSSSMKISDIQREIKKLRSEQQRIEQEIRTIDNKKLKERLQEDLDIVMSSIINKQMELDELAPQ